MKNKKFYILSIAIAILLITITTVASYAYFSASVTNSSTVNDSVVTTGQMELEFTDGPEVTLSNGLPGSYVEKTFTVRNVGTLATTYDVYFSDLINTFVDKSDLVYTLTSNDGGLNVLETQIPARAEKFIDSQPIGVNETHTYTLRITFKETNDNQDDNQGKKFKTIIRVNEVRTNDSLLGYLDNQDYGETGEYQDTIVANGVSYPVHVYNYVGDQVWTTSTVPNSGKFGSSEDIGTASTNATKMVAIKVDGDLTIGSGVTVQPYSTSYGGPKGFMIYVTGTLTNNGLIDNSHGGKAAGQTVYLWQNAEYTSDNNKYEVVPAAGATGAVKKKIGESGTAGTAGTNASGRATGGGGTGSGASIGVSYAGAGGRGSSYSGGTGSGSVFGCNSGASTSGAGSSSGGAGGAGWSNGNTCAVVGGAGNPNPGISKTASGDSKTNGASGSGGLLVIYANEFINGSSGTVYAKGAAAGVVTHSSKKYAGGSSGGGSINIFYVNGYTNNNASSTALSAAGGVRSNGGSGGNGTVTIGSIETGTFVKTN